MQNTQKLVSAIQSKTTTIFKDFDNLVQLQNTKPSGWAADALAQTPLCQQKNIYVQYYKNTDLLYTNTQLVLPDANKYCADSNYGIMAASTANTSFICYKKIIDSTEKDFLWIAIPMQDHYLINNNIIKNEHYFNWNFGNDCKIDIH